MNRILPRILAVVTLPPPTHGQAIVNQAVVDALSAHAPLTVINTSPGTLQKGVSYHLKRLRLNIANAIPAILNIKGGVVYTVVEPGYGMYYNFLIILFARIKQLRLVLHHHSAFYTKAYQLRFDWLSRLAGKGALHIALDDLMYEDIRTRYGSVVNVLVAHNACHVPESTVYDRRNRPFTCGFMSNLSREKGLDTFIGCFRAARSAGLELQALLAGPPTSFEAEKMIEEAKSEFGDALTVLGPVSGANKDGFFKTIDVFLFPTRYKYEAQPMVILEAMSCGVPVIATNNGYCTQLIGNAGVTASMSEFERAAIDFLTRCRQDINYWPEMRRRARSRYEMLRLEANAQLNDLVQELCLLSKCPGCRRRID